MKKFKNNKGFTLMEMLIVVAIIAILVAIAIPSFTTQLEKAREAADIANIRSTYAEAMVAYLEGDTTGGAATETSAAMTQTGADWKYIEWPEYLGDVKDCKPTKGQKVTVTISDKADGSGYNVVCKAVAGD